MRRRYTAPKAIATHPGVEECLDASSDSDYKHDVFLRDGWIFTMGRDAGARGHRVYSVAEFRDAAPRRVEHEHAPCGLCGVDCSTHPDAGNPLASCGDCGRPTCPDHRVDDAATRCNECAAAYYAGAQS